MAEAADLYTLYNLILFEGWQIYLPKGGIGKYYTEIRVTSVPCHYKSDNQS